MPNDFDPYSEWLGIPPEEQPADHYRLLGIEQFESDTKLIKKAAEAKIEFLRTFQLGKRFSFSQKLMAEVASARVCLLNSEKKAAYDAQLRGHSESAQEKAPVGPPTPQMIKEPFVEEPSKVFGEIATDNRTSRMRRQLRGKSSANKTSQRTLAVAGLITAVLILIGVIFWAQETKTNTQRDEKLAGSNTSSDTSRITGNNFRTKSGGEIAFSGPTASKIDPPEQKPQRPAPPKPEPKPEPTPKPAPEELTLEPTPTPAPAGDNDPEAAAVALLQSKGLEEGFNGTWELVNEQTRKLEAMETSGSSGTVGGAAFEAELKRRVDAKKKEILARWKWVSQTPVGDPQLDAEYHHLMTIVAFPDNPKHRHVRDDVSEITSIRAEVEQEFASRAPATVDSGMVGLIEDIRKRYATLAADGEVQAALKKVDGTLADLPNEPASTEQAPAGQPDAGVAERKAKEEAERKAQEEAERNAERTTIVSYYGNGQKSLERHYKNGQYDGLETRWYKNGQKRMEGHYKNGKQEGLHTSWHEYGQKSSEGHYKDGERDGLWTSWHDNGDKSSEGGYKDGKAEGRSTGWYANGQKARESHYKNGKRDGLFTGWYPNGQKISESHFKNGKRVR